MAALNPGDVVLYVDNYNFLGQTHHVFFKAEILSLDEKGNVALISPLTGLKPQALRVPTQYLKPESMEAFLNPQALYTPDSDVDPFIKAGEKAEAKKTWGSFRNAAEAAMESLVKNMEAVNGQEHPGPKPDGPQYKYEPLVGLNDAVANLVEDTSSFDKVLVDLEKELDSYKNKNEKATND